MKQDYLPNNNKNTMSTYDLLMYHDTGARGCTGKRGKYKKVMLSDEEFKEFVKNDEEIIKNIESLL